MDTPAGDSCRPRQVDNQYDWFFAEFSVGLTPNSRRTNVAISEITETTGALMSLQKSELNLIWVHCEMTGLDPEADRLLEMAVIVTGPDLTPRIEGPVLVLRQTDAQLDRMDAWNKGTHGRNGLIDKVRTSSITEVDAERLILDFAVRYVPKGASPMCCNGVLDRRFIVKYMPRLEAFFHYRSLDVSALTELAKRWRPDVYNSFRKQHAHMALADVHETIDQLAHYREHFLKVT